MHLPGPLRKPAPTPTEASLKSFAQEQLSSTKTPLGRKGVKAVLSQGVSKMLGHTRTPEVTRKQLKAYLKAATRLNDTSIKSILDEAGLKEAEFTLPLSKRTIQALAWRIDQALEQEQATPRRASALGGAIETRSSAQAVRPLPPLPTGVPAKMKAEIAAAAKTMEITEVEERALGLLGSLDPEHPLQKEDVQFLMHFLEGIAGDMALNKKYLSFQGNGPHKSAFHDLLNYTYNTQDLGHIKKITPKLEKINLFLNNQLTTLYEKDKLTFKDYKSLERTWKPYIFMQKIYGACDEKYTDIISRNPVFLSSKISNDTIDLIYEQVNNQFLNTLKTGDIVFWDAARIDAINGKKPRSVREKIIEELFPVGHAGKVANFPNVSGENLRFREMLKTHVDRPVESSQLISYSFYSLRVERLIPPKYHEALRGALGDKYLDHISEMYQDIEKEAQFDIGKTLEKNKINNTISTSTSVMLKVAAAAILRFGHKQLMPRPSGIELYKKLLKGSKKEMFCSEHTAYVTLLATELLNEQLCRALRQRYGNDFLKKDDVIKSPLGKHERIGVLDPTRLLEQLSNVKVDGKRVNALVKMGATPTEQAIFKKDAVSNAPDPMQLEVIKLEALQDFHKKIAEDKQFKDGKDKYIALHSGTLGKDRKKATERMDTLLAEHATHMAEGYKFLAYQLGLEEIAHPEKKLERPSFEAFFNAARPAMLQTLFLQEGKKRAGSDYVLAVINSFLEPVAPDRVLKDSQPFQVPDLA